jgi:hypothetical protein
MADRDFFVSPSPRRQSQSELIVSLAIARPEKLTADAGCDACRARKVKCTRDDPEDSRQSCKHCISLGIPCTYDYQPKKRGPPNL